MKRKEYEKALRILQIELCTPQDWVKQQALRVVVVFEGHDAAGKGRTIKAITERVSLRVFRVVALPAPSDREKSQLYLQRYVQNLPAAGEIVIFDRGRYAMHRSAQPSKAERTATRSAAALRYLMNSPLRSMTHGLVLLLEVAGPAVRPASAPPQAGRKPARTVGLVLVRTNRVPRKCNWSMAASRD